MANNITRKCWLWLLLIVQLCFIFCYWCLQTGLQQIRNENAIGYKAKFNRDMVNSQHYRHSKLTTTFNMVHFVTKAKNLTTSKNKLLRIENLSLRNVNNYLKDYLEMKTYRLMNLTGIENEMAYVEGMEIGNTPSIWCFREGTQNATKSNEEEYDLNSQLYFNLKTQEFWCKCKSDWHGRDCGQPEVMWRALLSSRRRQVKLREPRIDEPPHHLIYMLEGYFHNLDLLELQLKSVDEVVDYFLIYWSSKRVQLKSLKNLEHRLREVLKTEERYKLFYCDKSETTCNSLKAFAHFRSELQKTFKDQIKSTDLFMYTNENIILAASALKFLKYYETPDEMSLWRFRLKHNVYGFYWRHPNNTHLSGFICSFSHLGDGSKVQLTLESEVSNIIGDLNHYGGWYCQYCQHPDEIIEELHELQLINSSSDTSKILEQLPNVKKSPYIDTLSLQDYISQGIHIDGKTHLEKQRHDTEKYFAPIYAEKNKWKYGNLLINLFEAMDNDDIIEEAEGGAGF